MKQKVMLVIFSLVCALCCVVGFVACDSDNNNPSNDTLSVAGKTFVFDRVEINCSDDMIEYADQIKSETTEQMKNSYITFNAGGTCSIASKYETANGTYTQNGSTASMTVGGVTNEISVTKNSVSMSNSPMQGLTVTVVFVKGTPSGDKPSTPDNPDVPVEPECNHDVKNLYLVEDRENSSCTKNGSELSVYVCTNKIEYREKPIICGTVLSGDENREVLGRLEINSDYDWGYLIESGEIKERLANYRVTLPKADHTPVTDPAVAATCFTKGLTEGSHCGVCDTVLKAQTETDYTDHAYTDTIRYSSAAYVTDNVCPNCGRLEKAGYTFKTTLNDDGHTYTLVKGDGWENLSFASLTYNGKPVTVIGKSAFSECNSLTSVSLSGVKEIRAESFNKCNNLNTVNFGNSVEKIGFNAFSYCTGLTDVVIPDSVKYLGYSVFPLCDNIASITVPFVGGGEYIAYDPEIWDLTGFGTRDGYNYFGYIFGDRYYGGQYVPESLKSVTVTGGTIYSNAFDGYKNIETVVLDDNVDSVGNYAFNGCSGLTSIMFGSEVAIIGNYSFKGCESLTSIMFGSGVTSIGSDSFDGCIGLTSITVSADNTKYHSQDNCLIETENKRLILACKNSIIPADGSVTEIVYYAFRNCITLTSITIPDSVTSIASDAFEHCPIETATIPAFAGGNLSSSSLKSVVITSGDSIDSYSFRNCTSLASITLPDSLTNIAIDAFENCPIETATIPAVACRSISNAALKSVVITSGDSIDDFAFSGCASLTSIVFPDSVINISKGSFGDAFEGCINLESITVSAGNTKYHSQDNCLIETESKTLILGCKNSVIPADGSVTSIGSYAFRDCISLSSIDIPSNVTSIGSYAFSGCNSLVNLILPYSITSIGSAFDEDCVNLESIYYDGNIGSWCGISGLQFVDKSKMFIGDQKLIEIIDLTIPDDVALINYNAFSGCTAITTVTILSSVIDIMGAAFSDCPIETANIPIDAIQSIPKDKLKTVVITSGTSIRSNAFYSCNELTNLTISETVTNIAYGAFSGCSKLESLTLPYLNDKLGVFFGTSYSQNDVVPAALKTVVILGGTTIKDSTFESCRYITNIILPNSISTIGNNAFRYCDSLQYNRYDNGLYLGSEANEYIALVRRSSLNITSCQVNENTKFICNSAFQDCTELTSIFISASVIDIGNSVFSYEYEGCRSLESIIVADDNPRYRSQDNCLIDTESKTMILGCKNSIIPADGSVTSIDYAFRNCTTLTKITIPDSITNINFDAFKNCPIEAATIPAFACGYVNKSALNVSPLKSVVITSGDSIVNYAFRDCSNLANVVISASVNSIGSNAFENCTSIASVTISDNVTKIGEKAFSGCTSLVISCEKAEKPSGWSSDWNYSDCPIVWDCKNNDIATDGYIYVVVDGLRYSLINDNARIVKKQSNLTIANIPSDITYKDKLYSITLIETDTFNGCSDLTSITLENTITYIGYRAFYDCRNLTNITFNGTMEQWISIDKGDDWNYLTGGFTVTCSDGSLDKYGKEIAV